MAYTSHPMASVVRAAVPRDRYRGMRSTTAYGLGSTYSAEVLPESPVMTASQHRGRAPGAGFVLDPSAVMRASSRSRPTFAAMSPSREANRTGRRSIRTRRLKKGVLLHTVTVEGYPYSDQTLEGLFSFVGKAVKGIGHAIGGAAKGVAKAGAFVGKNVARGAIAAGKVGLKVAPYAALAAGGALLGPKLIGGGLKILKSAGNIFHLGRSTSSPQIEQAKLSRPVVKLLPPATATQPIQAQPIVQTIPQFIPVPSGDGGGSGGGGGGGGFMPTPTPAPAPEFMPSGSEMPSWLVPAGIGLAVLLLTQRR